MALFVCEGHAVDPDNPRRVALPSGTAVAIFKIEDQFYVTDDLCTHGEASLSEGFIEGYEIECPYHQGRFDIRNGKPTAAPCITALRTYKVIVLEDKVYIDDEG